jgi:1,4-alpha-glucan branching enzyme
VDFDLNVATAKRVSVVGDFNHWDVQATPLQRPAAGGEWHAAVRLPPGRHVYAFVVDGVRWVADPAAPRAVDNDFGPPNSVLTVVPARGST